MEEVTIFEIKKRVDNLIASGAKWHFHILTPRCMFNGRPQYAFVLENTSEKKVYIHYSIEPQDELGEELQKKLHKVKVTHITKDDKRELLQDEKELVNHANKLNSESKDWHHHVLFPECTFNENENKWTFVFEGEDANDVHEIPYKNKPSHLLKQIEPLFYKKEL